MTHITGFVSLSCVFPMDYLERCYGEHAVAPQDRLKTPGHEHVDSLFVVVFVFASMGTLRRPCFCVGWSGPVVGAVLCFAVMSCRTVV